MIIEDIKLNGYGKFLGTRELGTQIRNAIVPKLSHGTTVVIDFNNIEGITNSFADECFGKLIIETGTAPFKEHVKFTNLDPTEKSILNFALMNRTSAR
jgi:hypothetical protein